MSLISVSNESPQRMTSSMSCPICTPGERLKQLKSFLQSLCMMARLWRYPSGSLGNVYFVPLEMKATAAKRLLK